jgi:hypothetical protein
MSHGGQAMHSTNSAFNTLLERFKNFKGRWAIPGWVIFGIPVVGRILSWLGHVSTINWLYTLLPKHWRADISMRGNSLVWMFIASLLWLAMVALWPKKRTKLVGNQTGPDISLEWDCRKGWPKWDIVRLRNIGTESAFNVRLKFSWPELSFPVDFEINVIHAHQEIEREPQFVEKLEPDRINVGRMKNVLRDRRFQGHLPLEAIVVFFDKERTGFERPFTLEAGPGGIWGEEIKVTPGKRREL